MHSRNKLERETIIGWNEEEDTAWVQTSSPTVLKKLTRRLGPARKLSEGSWTWDIPKNWVKLPAKKRPREGKPLSAEHIAKMQKGRIENAK